MIHLSLSLEVIENELKRLLQQLQVIVTRTQTCMSVVEQIFLEVNQVLKIILKLLHQYQTLLVE